MQIRFLHIFYRKNKIYYVLSFLVFLLFYNANQLFSQELSIQLSDKNELILGIENKICIVVEEVPCENIYIVVENAEVKKENGCNYIFTPIENNIVVKIDIYKFFENDTVFIVTKYLRIKNMWPPQPMILCKFNGSISKEDLLKAKKIELYSFDLDLDLTRKIKKYDVLINRGFDKIFTTKVRGNRIPLRLKKQIQNLQTGDIIKFNVINKTFNDGSSYSESCVFRID
jgi:hypothetical protein